MDDNALVRHDVIGFLDWQPDMKVIGEASSGQATVQRSKEVRQNNRQKKPANLRASRAPG